MAQNSRRQEDLDLVFMNLNNDSLARKADVMQYPGERQFRSGEKGMENQRRKSAGKVQNVNVTRREEQRADRGDGSTGRRNPYLADYNSRNNTSRGEAPRRRNKEELDLIWGEEIEHPIRRGTRPAGGDNSAAGRRGSAAAPGREARTGRTAVGPGREARTGRTAVGPGREAGAARTTIEPGREARTGRTAVGPGREAGAARTAVASDREARAARTTIAPGREARTGRTVMASGREAGAVRTAGASGRAAVPDLARPVRRPEQVTAREQRRRIQQEKRRREILQRKLIMGIVEVVILAVIGILVFTLVRNNKEENQNTPVANPVETQQSPEPVKEEMVQGLSREVFDKHPEWLTDYLTPNEYSRPGDPLGKVTNIFVHYTANKNTSAKQNRSYFEQLKDTHERGASAHFIIGYEGEIIQCVPLDEIAYAVATRNEDSISIECCFKSDDGSFTQETYDSLIALLSWLTDAYGLESEDILRHYDCGGKKCPIYYTENEDAWEKLKADVRDYTL